MEPKDELRLEFLARWAGLWPDGAAPDRPPVFAGAGRAAERLRRAPEYRRARSLAVMADPVLLQARINALADNKTLLAATPGLKQGLVRVTPQMVPVQVRSRLLRGGSLVQAGKPLRPPADSLGKVEMLVVPALAVDRRGVVLGDGRGLADLLYALLREMNALTAATPVAVLAADEMVSEANLPAAAWDLGVDLVVTPTQTLRCAPPLRPLAGLDGLPPALAGLPLVRAAISS
ncbi:MAG: 5-formyltetrahydrofolate cyclo-ligase [Thermodesulfobacteriota bacterium]